MLKRNNVTRALARGSVLTILSTAGLLMQLKQASAQTAPANEKAVEAKPEVPAAEVAPASEPASNGSATPKAEVEGTTSAAPSAAPAGPGAPPAPEAPRAGYALPVDPAAPGAAPGPNPDPKALPPRVQTAQAQATIRGLQAKIEQDEADLARDYAQLRAAQQVMHKLSGIDLPDAPMEVYTHVSPDGRVVTKTGRGAITKYSDSGNSFGAKPTPGDAKDRDQRLSEIEHQLQALLNEVDKMRSEKPETAPEVSPPPIAPQVR